MSNSTTEIFFDEKHIMHQVKFAILLTLQIPSLVLSLLILIFFSIHRSILRARQNQALFVLLIINFIQVTFDLPMVIHYNHLGRVSPATHAYCTWWTFLEYTLNGAGEMLMATISIQRHIIVFNAGAFKIRSFRYLFHHLPLLICIIYPIILYLIIIVFDSCDGTQWDFNANVCGLANCFMVYNKPLAAADWGVNNGFPIIVITVANVALIIRVVRQRIRCHGSVSWRKQRKMTLQLLSISCLYIIAWFPGIIVAIIQHLVLPTFLLEIQIEYIFYLTYMICLFIPWICLGLFPEFIKWIWNGITPRKTSSVEIRSYFIEKDPFNGWTDGLSIFDSKEKHLLYHVKSTSYFFEKRVELFDRSSQQITATLTYSYNNIKVKQGEFSILNLSSNERLNGTIKDTARLFHNEYIMKWNEQSVLIETKFFSILTTFRYENHNEILATLDERVFSSLWRNKYDLQKTSLRLFSNVCGLANCYLVYNKVLGTFDWAVDNGTPIFLIILANVGLVLRVVRQRLRRQGLITWRKQRRMTIQLLSVSFLYFFAWFPNIFIGIIQQLFNPTFLFDIQFNYIFDLTYLICLLLPWICLGLFPEFIKWIRKLFSKRNQRQMTIRPVNDLT
ncbi:hypothetical protein I4U23_031201 [Adineta vaga]|nr:hypothetical protein I4U23_031201 [Adineta vaga]